MKLNTLSPIVTRRKKRLGLGYGSGKGGHTSSRGQKGQKSRNSVRLSFTGSSWVWFKRLPFIRGKSRFNSFATKTVVLTLNDLDKLKAGSTVTKETFQLHVAQPVKIVGTGKLTKALTVDLPATASAQKAILTAKGEYRGSR